MDGREKSDHLAIWYIIGRPKAEKGLGVSKFFKQNNFWFHK